MHTTKHNSFAMGRISDKVREIWRSRRNWNNGKPWTWHHFAVFFFSMRGQKRLWSFAWRIVRWFWRLAFGGSELDDQDYKRWRQLYMPGPKDFDRFRRRLPRQEYQPLISIVIPVFNPKLEYLKACITSIREQIYPNWELCLADDASTDPEVKDYLRSLESDQIRIVFRESNGHIAACTNSALEMASGAYVAFADQDDLLTRDALFHVVEKLNEDPTWDIVYTDEDKVTEDGDFIHPHFKPEWCPENFMTRNYLGHLVVVRRSLVEAVGGFRVGLEGAQDFDLLLRITERTKYITNVPRVLYHWRRHEASTALNETAKTYAFDHGEKALNDALVRRNIEGEAKVQEGLPGIYTLRFPVPQDAPKVTILVPSKDKADVLGVCLKSVFEKTTYPNFEVLLLSNNSSEESFFQLVEDWEKREPERFRWVRCDYPFNYSKLTNDGVALTDADYILLLNNDTEVIHGDWILRMLEYAQQPEIGAVGVKLLFPNGTVQHGGVVIGLGGVAGHTFLTVDRNDPGYFHQLRAVSNYSAVTAACLLVEARKFHEIDGFNDFLEVEYNDVDFCLRLREAGYRNVFLPDVELYHYESLTRGHPHSTRSSYKRHLREVKYMKDHWGHLIEHDPCYSPNLSKTLTHFNLNFDKKR
ncbi:MAG: glycosyltransferase family 2 protein [Leptolyngbya sp. SIO3F4]|nr:glycosyltransferase family 2 protein [Leptolyngbya sp. SIO3F4]